MLKKTLIWLLSLFLIINTSYSYDNYESDKLVNWYDEIININISKDWKNIIYQAKKDWKWFIVKNWKESKKYDKQISWLEISSDFKNYSYEIIKERKIYLIESWVEKDYCKDFDEQLVNYYNWETLVYCATLGNLFAFEPKSETYKYYYDWKEINNKEYRNIKKLIQEKYNIENSNNCDYKSSWKKQEDWFYHILKNWKSIKTFENNVSVKCYDNWNKYYYIYSNKSLFKTEIDSKYDNTYFTIGYTLVVDWKEYNTKTNINYLAFYSNWNHTAFILKDLNYNQLLYVDWKLIKKLSNENNLFNGFKFSPNWKEYMFSYVVNQSITYLNRNWIEIVNNKGFRSIDFKYSKNWDYFYILGKYKKEDWILELDRLFKNWNKVLYFLEINLLNRNSYTNDSDYILVKDFGKESIMNLSSLWKVEKKVKEKLSKEEFNKLVHKKKDSFKNKIYQKYWEEKFKRKIQDLYDKNPEKVKTIHINIVKKIKSILKNTKISETKKINDLWKYWAFLEIFKDSLLNYSMFKVEWNDLLNDVLKDLLN